MKSRELAVRVLEALADGDPEAAAAWCRSALEDYARGARLRYRCACGCRFEWPGQLDEHLMWTGHVLSGRAAA